MPSNWWMNTQPGPASPGGTTYGGGGGYLGFRNDLDARRSMAGQESQYPDGYLGTITNRQEDKVLGKVQERLTDRSYQRGVHLGSKIGQQQYSWSQAVNPQAGILREAQTVQQDADGKLWVQRWTPSLDPVERLAHMGKTAAMTDAERNQVARQFGVTPAKNPDPDRRAAMQNMLPRYAL